jgi:hypothetical protein
MANKRKESEAATNLKNKELPIEKGSQQTDRASFLEDLAGGKHLIKLLLPI